MPRSLADFFYTNDLKVLIDVVLRQLDTLDDKDKARSAAAAAAAVWRCRQHARVCVQIKPYYVSILRLIVLNTDYRSRLYKNDQILARINQLKSAKDSSKDTKMACEVREVAVCLIFQRRHALDEELYCVQVTRVGDAELPVVLRHRIDDRVKLALLLRLELPIGVHGQLEGIFPSIPVVDLDPLVLGEWEDVVL